MIRSFDFQRQNAHSKLASVHPIVKAYVTLVISFLLILLQRVESLLFVNSLVLFLLFFAGLSLRQLGVIALFLAVSLYSIVFSQGLFYSIEPLTPVVTFFAESSFSVSLTREGMEHGLLTSLRILAPLVLTFLIYSTTPIESFLSGFQSLRLPQAINLMVITALRFIPLCIEDYRIIRRNQSLRGYRFTVAAPVRSIRFEMAMLKPLFFTALRQSTEIAYAALGRGFLNPASKKQRRALPFSRSEKAAVFVLTLVFLVIFLSKVVYFLYLNQLLYVEELRSLYEITRYYL